MVLDLTREKLQSSTPAEREPLISLVPQPETAKTANVVVESINSAIKKSENVVEQKRIVRKQRNKVLKLIDYVKKKLGLTKEQELEEELKLIDSANTTEAKLRRLEETIRKATQQVEQEVELKIDEEVETESQNADFKEVVGKNIDDLDERQQQAASEELDARLEAALKLREVLNTDVPQEVQNYKTSPLPTDKKTQLRKKAALVARLEVDLPDESINFKDVISQIEDSNPTIDKNKARREAMRVSAIIAEQQKLRTNRNLSSDQKRAITADLRALSSDTPEDEKRQTGKYLERLRGLTSQVEVQALHEGETERFSYIQELDNDPELKQSVDVITEMLQDSEIRKSFVESSDNLTRTNLAIITFESDLREKLANQEFSRSETLVSDSEIKKIVRDMFPPSMALAVEAAGEKSSSETTKAQQELQEYMIRRKILEDTLTTYRDRIQANVSRYTEVRKGNETSTKEIFIKLQKRKGRETLRGTGESEGFKGRVGQYLTHGGNTLLVLDNVEDVLNVAPDLYDTEGNRMTRDQVKAYIETETDVLGDESFQMAVKLEDGEDEETVLVVYKKTKEPIDVQLNDLDDEAKIGLLTEAGYNARVEDKISDDEIELLLSISPTVIYHEVTHGIKEDYITAKKKAIALRRDQIQIDSQLQSEERSIRLGILKKIEEQFFKEEPTKRRMEKALDELAAKIEERRALEYRADIAIEDDLNIGIELADIYVVNPDDDPGIKEERLSDDEVETIKAFDNDLQHALDLINIILDSENREVIQQRILELHKQTGLEIDNLDVEEYLKYYIVSYLQDGGFDNLDQFITDLERILEGFDIPNRREADYAVREKGVISADPNSRLRDPVTIANNALNNSPLFPKDVDAHMFVPMHYSVPIPVVDHLQKYVRARARYHMFKPYYKDLQKMNFDDFWEVVSNNPMMVAQKDKGEFFTPEILGAWVRQTALHGKNPDNVLGYNMIDNNYFDPRTGRYTDEAFDNGRLKPIENLRRNTGKTIDTGLAGRAMATWENTPGLRRFYPRYYSAPWGMAMEKAFGRGPVARMVGRVFWGKSVMPGAEKYQKIGFNESPNWKFVPGFYEGESPVEPDGLPGVIMHQEGNMTPYWDKREKAWKMAARLPVESVLPSMEYNRAAMLTNMLGMMAKSGIDEQSLRFMIMKYLPELNFQNREGVPGYDITEYRKSLRESDLNYERRLESNKLSIAKYTNEVRKQIFGNANADGEFFDLDEFEDYDKFKELQEQAADDSFPSQQVVAQQRLNALYGDLARIKDPDIIRGHVSEDTVNDMITFLNNYLDTGIGSLGSSAEKARIEQQPAMIMHVFRAMQHENAIRSLRKNYLLRDPSLGETLEQWNKEVEVLIDEKIKEDKQNKSGKSRYQIKEEAFNDFITRKGTLSINLRNGRGSLDLNADQISKLFVYRDVEGASQKFVFDYGSEENVPFGLGDLEKLAYNTEWNYEEGSRGKDMFVIGGGFRLHKMEVQAFQRTLHYIQSRDIMRRGLPADAINIPGETPQYDRTLTDDLWEQEPNHPTEEWFFVQAGNKQAGVETYSEGYFKKLESILTENPTFPPQMNDSIRLQRARVFEYFKIDGATDAEKFANLHQIFVTPEGFNMLIKACENDPELMKRLFGQRAQLQATFLNERNQLHTIKPVKPASDLNMRFFEQGAMLQEVEEHLTRIEEQNEFYTVMRLFLKESRKAIPMSKARSEIFKKHAQYIKYFRWAVLGYTAFVAINTPGFLPTVLPLPPEIYLAMVALSYYEAYYLSIKQKYWGMREMNAIKYSDEMSEFTNRLEQSMNRLQIPSTEEQEQYAALKNRYEKFFEQISDVDSEELSPKNNATTTFIGRTVAGFVGGG